MKAVLGGLVAASLLASPALAQSASGSWNGLPDRFRIDTGYSRLSADTQLRLNSPAGGSDVDFAKDLGVDEEVDTFWLNGNWRVGRRHQLELGFTRLSRERAGLSL
jgi:hypothetical protein